MLFSNTWSLENNNTTENRLENSQIISKFDNLDDANKLVDSLKKSGQSISIIVEHIDIKLKILSVGLYPDKEEAETVIRHLKKNDIDAYAVTQQNGMFRVYAGAMQDEEHYWQRFETLLGLGYRRIHTELKASKAEIFYVTRPKNETLPIPYLPPPDTSQLSLSHWDSEFMEGRFKGEFTLGGTQENRYSANYFNAIVSARTTYKYNWDVTYGLRFQAMEQSAEQSYQILEKDWRPTYLRYRQPNNVWTIGAINAVWDDRNRDSLSNRLDSKDLSRLRLDSDQTEREQPIFALRWEFEQAEHKLDVIWTPLFRPAKLPRFNSIWHPVNRSNRQILGVRADNTLEQLIEKGSFDDEELLTGGIGIRMARQVGSRTMATTLQFARRQEPYYRLNPETRSFIENGQTVNTALTNTDGSVFTPEHPYTGILSWEEFGSVSQMELAMVTNSPYTTKQYAMKTAAAFEWRLGFIYPKTDKYSLISAFFHGRHINTKESMLERNTQLFIAGTLSRETENRLWRLSLDYDVGISQFDLFLNPKIIFTQNKNINIYLGYQLFSGSDGTYSGHHSAHSITILGWKANF